MIWEELKTKLIFIDLDAKDTKEVFEQVGGAFIKEGYAKETYIQGLIDREAYQNHLSSIACGTLP